MKYPKTPQAEEFLKLLGCMARDFSGIEDTVTLYIERYVGTKKVAQIFIKHMNFSTKCERLKELLKVVSVDRENKEKILAWLKEAQKCSKMRNEWLHTAYAVNSSGKPVSAQRNDDGSDYLFNEVDLNKAIKDSVYINQVNRAGFGKVN